MENVLGKKNLSDLLCTTISVMPEKKDLSVNDVYTQRLEKNFLDHLESIKTILENRLGNRIECKLVKRGIFYHVQFKPKKPFFTEETLFNNVDVSQFIENFLEQSKTSNIEFIYEESYSYIAINKEMIRKQVMSVKDKDSYSLMFNLDL